MILVAMAIGVVYIVYNGFTFQTVEMHSSSTCIGSIRYEIC